MSGKTYLNSENFFKPDYYQALEYITPKYLIQDDRDTFGEETDLTDSVINSHIDVASNFSSILNVSNVAGTTYSSINRFVGIAPYFVKQNNLTNIKPDLFDLKILGPLGKSFSDFKTNEEFSQYVSGTLIPAIRLNNPNNAFGSSFSSAHIYLIQNLSWLYFLNTSGPTYNPSSYVSGLLVNNLFQGKPIQLNDCLKGLSEHLFKNNLSSYIPSVFLSSTGTYTSGTQQLEKLQTWVDVVYSPSYANRSDFTVRDRFDIYINSQLKIENKVPAGPFHKLLRAISFLAFDINNDSEQLGSLYDIEDCPDEYLPYLAELIGWKLFGSNPDRWRLQLRNAIEVYKRVGTKKSLQFALNTVFPKDQFLIESRVIELWESYVPYLIYYALATESNYFKSKEDWTRTLASQLQVIGYSNTSLDENIRLVVDKILYDTYQRFRNSFNIPNQKDQFYFRNRRFPIPPFEEYPYYMNVELTKDMVNFIADRLVCFGVRNQFALDFISYIDSNVFDSDDEIRSNSWLFFTSGYNEPPNLDRIVQNLNSEKFEYVSLWSGKSSHFKLLFDAQEFDFTNKDENDFESGDAVNIASQIVKEFSPANAIPLVNLQLSSSDLLYSNENQLPIVGLDEVEQLETSRQGSNYFTSGYNVNAYNRTKGSGNVFDRYSMQTLRSSLLTGGTSIGNVYRNTVRRKNYERLLPKNGYYDRTGFNQPVSFDPSSSLSGIVLGFIPSSMTFEDVSSVHNLPLVYQSCYGSDDSATIYGYAVSNTLRCRGSLDLTWNDYYTDRGQLPEIYAAMHEIKEDAKWYEASALSPSSSPESQWKNVYQSSANYLTEVSGWFPNSVSDYHNFRFGRDLHKLYKIYTSQYERHRLTDDLFDLDGPNIFSHTYGPYLYNHDFDLVGSNLTTSLSSIVSMGPFNTYFPLVASSTSSMYIDNFELYSSSIVSGIELVQTSGSFTGNRFVVARLPISQKLVNTPDYMYDRTFILMKSVNGLPRIRFDLSKYPLDSNLGYPLATNFLLPDSNYKLNLQYLIGSDDGTKLGGRIIGIWVHTKPEESKMWSLDKNGNWVQHSQLLTKQQLLNSYVQEFNIPLTERSLQDSEDPSGIKFKCLEIVAGDGNFVSPLVTYTEKDFSNLEFEFDTFNNDIELTNTYTSTYSQVHRKNQKYVIEVFLIPNQQSDSYLILDKVDLVNTTLNTMSKYLVFDGCPQIRSDISEENLKAIFKFFNDIAGKNARTGIASRDSNESSSINGPNGGSRLDYRRMLDWNSVSYYVNSIIEQIGFTV